MKYRKTTRWLFVIGVIAATATIPVVAAGPTATMFINSLGCDKGVDPALIGIPILNFSMAGERAITFGGGATGGTQLAPLEVKVVKQMDQCTIGMFSEFTRGRRIEKMELRVYDASKTETMRVTYENVFVTAIVYAPGQEGVTFVGEKITVQYGSGAGIVHSCFDFIRNTPCP